MSDEEISEWDDLNAGLEILRLRISELEASSASHTEGIKELRDYKHTALRLKGDQNFDEIRELYQEIAELRRDLTMEQRKNRLRYKKQGRIFEKELNELKSGGEKVRSAAHTDKIHICVYCGGKLKFSHKFISEDEDRVYQFKCTKCGKTSQTEHYNSFLGEERLPDATGTKPPEPKMCPECKGTLEIAINNLTGEKDGWLCMGQCGQYFTKEDRLPGGTGQEPREDDLIPVEYGYKTFKRTLKEKIDDFDKDSKSYHIRLFDPERHFTIYCKETLPTGQYTINIKIEERVRDATRIVKREDLQWLFNWTSIDKDDLLYVYNQTEEETKEYFQNRKRIKEEYNI